MPDYVVIGGVEVISTARAQALGAEAGECGADEVCWDCEDGAAEWLNNGEPYGTVEDAPWFDPAVPESRSVLGFGGLEITGMTERVGTTGNAPARREFTLRFAAFLADECGLEYAQGWLSNVFSPSPCATSCVGHEMCMLACCPDVDDDGELVGPDPLRHLYDVEVVSGPTMIERSWEDPLWIEYEVTLSTPNVYVWRPPPDQRVWRVRPSDGQVVTLDLPAVYEACPDDDDCATEFACPSPDFAPLPAEPLPACYPAEPFSAHRTLVSVPSRTMPRGVDVVPVIHAEAGNRPLRNLVVRFYDNPLDVPCDRLPDMNPCRACMDLTVTEIPPNGSIIMDGRTGLNTITCKNSRGRDVQIPASVYGPPVDGVGAGYVDAIPCGPGICLEIYTAEGAAINAEVVVEFWTRTNGALWLTTWDAPQAETRRLSRCVGSTGMPRRVSRLSRRSWTGISGSPASSVPGGAAPTTRGHHSKSSWAVARFVRTCCDSSNRAGGRSASAAAPTSPTPGRSGISRRPRATPAR